MINQPPSIYTDFVPGGFDGIRYLDRLRHKHVNEMNNKIKELRRIKLFLEQLLQDLETEEQRGILTTSIEHMQFLTQLRVFMNENDLLSKPPFYLQDSSQQSRNLCRHKSDV